MKTDLVEIFQTIRAELQPYVTLGFSNRVNSENSYDLWSDKNVVIAGEQQHELFFVSVSIEDGHVALYYNSDVATSEMKYLFDTQLLKLAEGESCLHIKALDGELLSMVIAAVAGGYKLYKEKGWVN